MVPKAELDATPDAKTGDTVTHPNAQATPSCIPGRKGSQVETESMVSLGLETSKEPTGDPTSKDSGSIEHEDAQKMESAAQEGVDAVQHMLEGANPESPVFLSDMVKTSKKRKKNDNGKWL